MASFPFLLDELAAERLVPFKLVQGAARKGPGDEEQPEEDDAKRLRNVIESLAAKWRVTEREK